MSTKCSVENKSLSFALSYKELSKGGKEIPTTSWPCAFKIAASHEPLNPVWPVIK
jgi:hypothetical protein